MAGFDFILCADDFGMTEAVSRGLMQAACAGRISAASAMSSMPDWRRAAQDWRASRPDVDLGLHLTLTVGGPLGRMDRFAGTGEFPDLGVLLRGALSARLPLGEIEEEFVRQIDAFCDGMDAAPTHVDGHQHVHLLPGVRDALISALSRRGLRVAVRDSSNSPGRVAARRAFALKAAKVNALGVGFRRAAQAGGLELNDGFAGYSDFVASRYGAGQFETYLVAPGPRHLVMCHPGLVDDALRLIDPVTNARETELAFLLSQEFTDLLSRREARLIRTSGWLTQP